MIVTHALRDAVGCAVAAGVVGSSPRSPPAEHRRRGPVAPSRAYPGADSGFMLIDPVLGGIGCEPALVGG